MSSLLGTSYYYYNATGIREDMCGFEEFTHEPDPFEFRPTPPIVLKKKVPPLIGIGAGGEELTIGDQALLGCKCYTSRHFITSTPVFIGRRKYCKSFRILPLFQAIL